MNAQQVASYLKNEVTLFQMFREDEIQALVNGSRLAAYEPNEFIFEFGEDQSHLGIMLEGDAEFSITRNNGDRQVIGGVKAGEFFGEAAMMTGDPCVADCICTSASRALLIPRELCAVRIMTNPAALVHLSRNLVSSLKQGTSQENTGLASIPSPSDDPYGLTLRTEQPMKLLIINCGSSSLKFTLFDTMDTQSFARGQVERIGLPDALLTLDSSNGNTEMPLPDNSHSSAFSAMLTSLKGAGIITNLAEITAVAHRNSLGGEKHRGAVLVTEEIIKEMEGYTPIFPLHNPHIINGIRVAQTLLPDAIHVTVFDSSFHNTIPSFAYLYALPYEYYKEKGLRRFGYHGSSHKYASLKAAQFLKKPFNKLETIVCHLGSGSSICGIDHGRSVDTTMGFSPLEGLIMGTRCGDLDPGLLLYLMKYEGMGYDDLDDLLNRKSGLLGLSGVSSDMREIQAAADEGNNRAMLAIKTYAYRVRKYIGAYVAAMEGLDVLVFTGGIGQGSVLIRSLACQGLARMGICLDEEKNRKADGFNTITDIAAKDALVRILVIPADEERMIARDTLATLERQKVIGLQNTLAPMPVTIEVSAHHIHLSQEHVEALFGTGHKLTRMRDLNIPSAFACEEKVNLIGPKGQVKNVRILGPERPETQVEISMTEQYKLGIHPPIRESGDLDGTPGLTIEGPNGRVTIEQGVICAMRHIHATPADAKKMGIKDKDVVRVKVAGDRELIFGDVLVRVHPSFKLYMHIDTDEANAANIQSGTMGYVEAIQLRH